MVIPIIERLPLLTKGRKIPRMRKMIPISHRNAPRQLKEINVRAIYYIKLKSRLSVRPSVTLRNPAVSAWTDVRFARNEAPILGVPVVSFTKVLIAVVRRLRRVECPSVDISC